MVQGPFIECHGIFVWPEARKVIIQKVLKLPKCSIASCSPAVSRFVIQALCYLSINFVARVVEPFWPGVILRWWQPIIGIKVPAALFWLTVRNQQIKTNSLSSIEVLHYKTLLATGPLLK